MSCERPDSKEDVMRMQSEDEQEERKRRKPFKSNKKYKAGEF